jgi:F-box/WD-40 domain protein MET30
MCLQFHQNLSTPSYPVLITGSYDRTVRVWDLDKGEVVRVLQGHASHWKHGPDFENVSGL